MNVGKTATRVTEHTPQAFNDRIAEQTRRNIEYFAHEGHDEIERRLDELDEEWDIERVLETQASSLVLASALFSALFGKKWLFFSGAVAAFLLQHAVQGWCPPVPVLRRLGIRTAREIEDERHALMTRVQS